MVLKSAIKWVEATFEQLTTYQLYDILQLRNVVFIIEQDSIYLDLDNGDKISSHLMGYDGDTLAAYCRVFRTGEKYPEGGSIGRVVVNPDYRTCKLGDALMERAIRLHNRFNSSDAPIIISAQAHLRHFYEKHLFSKSPNCEGYLEDGIPHIRMQREPQSV